MSDIQIRSISFEDIQPVWSKRLWPDRRSPIEPTSAIDFDGRIEMTLLSATPEFWAAELAGQTIGVVSGFRTSSERFRSRGLWVDPAFRRRGVATKLIETIAGVAIDQGCRELWTMPRFSAAPFYRSCGFQEWLCTNRFEFGPHFFCIKPLGSLVKGKTDDF